MTSSLLLDSHGRRSAFAVSSVLYIIGSLVQAAATSYAMLTLGMAFNGLASGYSLANDPGYIAELSPVDIRGYYVTWPEVAVSLGGVLGFVSGLLVNVTFSSVSLRWRVMSLTLIASPVLLIFALMTILPESPRWLAVNGRTQEAVSVLLEDVGISKMAAESLVDEVLQDMSLKQTRKFSLSDQTVFGFASWTALLQSSDPVVRYVLLVGIGAAVCPKLSAIDPVLFEFLFVVEDIGITSTWLGSLLLVCAGTTKLFASILSALVLDKVGRRPIIVGSAALSFGLLCAVAVTFGSSSSSFRQTGGFSTLIVALICVFIFFYEIGVGPASWLIPSEVYYNKIRVPAMGMATVLNRLFFTILVGTAVSLRKRFGWFGFFFCYAVTSAISFAFFLVYLPETSGRRLEEMYDYCASIITSKNGKETTAGIPATSGASVLSPLIEAQQ